MTPPAIRGMGFLKSSMCGWLPAAHLLTSYCSLLPPFLPRFILYSYLHSGIVYSLLKKFLDEGEYMRISIFTLIVVLACATSSSAGPAGTSPKGADSEPSADKSPAQLIELWDDASHAERVTIQDRLIDNIPAAIPVLRNKTLVGTQGQKLLACAMIAELRDTDSVPILLKAIDDKDDKVKIRAISSLRILKANQATDRICQEMSITKSKGVLKASLAALGTVGSPQDVAVLRIYLKDPDESVRVDAAAAMALLGNYDGQNILIAGTQSSSPGVKKEATYSLGFLDTDQARNTLRGIMSDPNGQWKSYAGIALIQQELLNKSLAQQLIVLEAASSDENQRVAEWSVEKIADMDIPQGTMSLQRIVQNGNAAGTRASRLLRIRGAK
jgi:hypothetical protein